MMHCHKTNELLAVCKCRNQCCTDAMYNTTPNKIPFVFLIYITVPC